MQINNKYSSLFSEIMYGNTCHINLPIEVFTDSKSLIDAFKPTIFVNDKRFKY